MDTRSFEESTPLLYAQGDSYLALGRQAATPNEENLLLPMTGVPAFSVVLSPNIAAGGEATTMYGMVAPSGKSGSEFTTGRRWDDENGLDSLTIAADFWTKIGWAIQANSAAVTNGQQYEFRVVADGVPLDTYSFTPRLTIGSAATPKSAPPPRRRSVKLATLMHF